MKKKGDPYNNQKRVKKKLEQEEGKEVDHWEKSWPCVTLQSPCLPLVPSSKRIWKKRMNRIERDGIMGSQREREVTGLESIYTRYKGIVGIYASVDIWTLPITNRLLIPCLPTETGRRYGNDKFLFLYPSDFDSCSINQIVSKNFISVVTGIRNIFGRHLTAISTDNWGKWRNGLVRLNASDTWPTWRSTCPYWQKKRTGRWKKGKERDKRKRKGKGGSSDDNGNRDARFSCSIHSSMVLFSDNILLLLLLLLLFPAHSLFFLCSHNSFSSFLFL